MFKKHPDPGISSGKIDNVLGANTSIHGTLKSDGNLRVDGVVEGRIETAGNVIVGPSARVLADIVGNAVQVWGAVRGNVTAQSRLEILPTGRVWGDIRVASLLIDEGGVFRGHCIMAGEDADQALPTTPAIREPEAPRLALAGPETAPETARTAAESAAATDASQPNGNDGAGNHEQEQPTKVEPHEAWSLPSLKRMRDAVAESAARVAVARASYRDDSSGA